MTVPIITQDAVAVWLRCKEDFQYFFENFVYLQPYVGSFGSRKFTPTQSLIVDTGLHDPVWGETGRGTGRTTLAIAYILHNLIFNDEIDRVFFIYGKLSGSLYLRHREVTRNFLLLIDIVRHMPSLWVGDYTVNIGQLTIQNHRKRVIVADIDNLQGQKVDRGMVFMDNTFGKQMWGHHVYNMNRFNKILELY